VGELSATTSFDQAIARLATAQHGVVSLSQLAGTGLGRNGVTKRVEAGRLHRVHWGVYAVGHARLTEKGRWLAAVLTCGGGAVLSHRSAAALWGMRPQSSGPIEITVPTSNGRRKRRGLWLHRSTTLIAASATREDGIPVTTPARTIADLRRALPPDHLDAAIRRAEILRLDIGPQPGFEPDRAKSDIERDFLRLCRKNQLPEPEVNEWIGDYQVDFLWRAQKIIVEMDSWKYHGTRSSFEADRKRDVELKLLGYEVLRFTDRQLTREPDRLAPTLRALLAPRRASDR
jgi:very-short-patch-repair endonuclease